MIYPEFIKKEEIIGIFAPSAGVGHKIESFDSSLNVLRSRGYKIVETDSVRVDDIRPASGKKRAEEYHELLSNPEVVSIISASGGEFCIEMLPHLDSDLILSRPKWLCGYSDPTNLEYYITTKLDIATIYGFNAGGFDWDPLHKFQEIQLEYLSGNLVTQESYDYYDSDRSFNKTSFNLDTPVRWDLYLPESNAPINSANQFSGRIIGGCTDVIAKLVGTEYDGCPGFIEKYSSDGFMWYFDTFEMNPLDLYRTILHFKYAGMFKNAKIIIFGRVMFPGDASDSEYVELLKDALPDIPFIWNADIGHTKPCMTLINGALGHLQYENGVATLNMELK